MRRRSRLLSITTAGGLAALGFAIGPAAHVLAGPTGGASGWCNDGVGGEKEIPILTSPVVLAVELGANGDLLYPHVGICYSTTPENSSNPETAGGSLQVWAQPPPNDPDGVYVANNSDPGAALQANFGSLTTPTYTVNPGGTSGGQVLTVYIPVSVCANQCVSPTLNTTGLIVGTLEKPQAAGGVNQDYALTGLCVMVDGVSLTNCANTIQLGGVTTTGNSPLEIESGGPCVFGLCLPVFGNSYIGTNNDQLATVYVPGTSIGIPVNSEDTCVYHTPSTNPCP